ncbi:hypothetical protein DYB31_007425 [Aphanomyces astaci]|uniref:ABC transporter domain-containing protein n=1 Tax=Aphanomyces astaci TaxID=112090 RepID=A0A397EUP0_APHAT|nr:hypothetical protein DYB31_007425 [Aphanomyces astaci]
MKHVDYVVPVLHSHSHIETLTSAFQLPWFNSKKQNVKYILKNVNAIFKPGTMTLVLGPPGCGKTTLLKHLAGILHVKGNEQVGGSVTYNGCKPSQIDLSSLAAYVQQSDNHYPTLTVKETFEFSHKCLVGTVDPNDPLAVNEQHMVDILISVFGLSECADTIIGDDMIRGVSGGQKRRVTVGEMMTGRATTLLLDEFSNGLDASTTYDIAKAVRTMAEVLEKTVVMTMLQPPPEVYDLFDNILVLDKGEVVYNGPRTTLPSYFRTIGYECPPRKDVADFLQEVTTHLGPRYATTSKDDHSTSVGNRPTTASEFAAAFEKSSIFHTLLSDLDKPETLSPSMLPSSTESKVRLHYMDCLRVVFLRTWTASLRDIGFNIARLVQALVLGVIVGTTFFGIGRNTDVAKEAHLVPIKVSMFFLALTYQALTTISTIDTSLKLRHVLYKQSAYHFFHPSAYVVSDAVVELLWSVPQLVLFGTPVYFCVGLYPSVGAYFTFVLVVYLCAATYALVFKFVTMVSPDAVLAKVVAIFVIFLHIVFSGYVTPAPQIPLLWQWLYWTNPLAWALRALVLNEFLSSTPLYETMVPIGQDVWARVGSSALEAYGFTTNAAYIPGAIVFLVGAILVLVTGTTLAIQFVRFRPSMPRSDLKSSPPLAPPSQTGSATIRIASHDLNNLPFQPVALTFQSLSYTIDIGKGKNKTSRQLLKGIHGCFQPGSLTALMGSTGAGKTTLMDVIAGRKTTGTIEGDLFVNGHPLDRRTFTQVSGYCEQNDVHEETATIREAFHFSAALRLPSDTTQDQRQSFVDDILDVLELTPRANAQYLTLSQGERKRVTIGVELLSNPSILFLDEPTTGLDSRAATIVMECVKRIAESGRTVVCTIHQPSTVLFELFDKLLLLKTGGELVYFGDLGPQSSVLLEYFRQFQGLPPMEPHENPATYMLNCIGAGTGKAKIDVDFAALYRQSDLAVRNQQLMEQGQELVPLRKNAHSFGTQFVTLLQRQSATYWRSPSYNTSRLVLMVVVPLIFGSVFHGMELTTSMDVLSQLTFIFVATSFLCISMMTTSLPFVSQGRNVFYRERQSNMYAPAAHSLSLAVVELGYSVVLSSVFVHSFYWLCGLDGHYTRAWLWFWAFMTSSVLLWSYVGQLLVFWLPTPQMAELLGGGLASLSFIFSGFMIDVETLAVVWRWVYWISPVHYMLEGIVMAQYHDQTAPVVDVLTKTNVAIRDFVEGFFNHTFSPDMIGRNMVLLWVVIGVVQLLLLCCMTAINHTTR